MPPEFGRVAYWDARFAASAAAQDWLMTAEDAAQHLEPLLAREDMRRVLHLGCGTSRLPAVLAARGHRHVLHTDASSAVIRAQALAAPELRWRVLDVRELRATHADASLDLVVDKSVTDALACADDRDAALETLARDVHAVLRRGGVWWLLSYSTARNMAAWDPQAWRVQHTAVAADQDAEAQAGAKHRGGVVHRPRVFLHLFVLTKA